MKKWYVGKIYRDDVYINKGFKSNSDAEAYARALAGGSDSTFGVFELKDMFAAAPRVVTKL